MKTPDNSLKKNYFGRNKKINLHQTYFVYGDCDIIAAKIESL